ncbi:MAG: efflux RND transporter periplasmic adaptor subunit [Candidatus Sumerlaeota bacterium]|nr:efflux RND transporter periplasmic adaptor subunit [Candidatus Sumerlaeota bacterium]
MPHKHPFIWFFLALLAAGAGWGIYQVNQPRPTVVRTAKAETLAAMIATVNATGEIRAHDMVDIQTEVAGVIVELPIKEGQIIRKNDVLLRIDPFQAQSELDGARSRQSAAQSEVKRCETMIASAESALARQGEQIKTSESELEESSITLKRAKDTLERQRPLLATKIISTDQFEEYESLARLTQKRLEAATARLEQARMQLNAAQLSIEEQQSLKAAAEHNLASAVAAVSRVQDMLAKATLRSPLDGVVVQLNVDAGERAVPGIQSDPRATLMSLANLDTIEAELEVDETDIVRVELGQEAKITADALPDKPMRGRVSEIGRAPIKKTTTTSQEGKDFKVVVLITKPLESLRMGMTCEAEITVATRTVVLTVPIQSLTAREVEVDGKGAYVAPPKPEKKKSSATAQTSGGTGAAGVANAAGESGQPAGVGTTGTASPAASKTNAKKNAKKELQGVFVFGADGFAHFRPTKSGIMDKSNVEIQEGIKEGDEIITGPLQALRTIEEWALVKREEK